MEIKVNSFHSKEQPATRAAFYRGNGYYDTTAFDAV